jgi:hypothetical protein
VDPGSQWDTQTVSTNRLYHAKIVILWGECLCYFVLNCLLTEVVNYMSRKPPPQWALRNGIPTHVAFLILNHGPSQQRCTSGMPSGGVNENLRTRRNFWNLVDQIISSSSEVMTADFCITYLGTPCISILQQEKRCLCWAHVIYVSRMHPKSKILDTHVRTSDFGSFISDIPLYCKYYRIVINYR